MPSGPEVRRQLSPGGSEEGRKGWLPEAKDRPLSFLVLLLAEQPLVAEFGELPKDFEGARVLIPIPLADDLPSALAHT